MQRTFKRVLGITPRQYAEARRLDAFKARLREGQAVSEALYEAGYGSSSRLYERAPAQMGMTPTAYRQGGAGMQIRYSIVDCALGRLLVAATTRGLCMVSLGDSDSNLEAALWREYPAAAIARDDEALHAWLHELLRHLAGQQPHLDLPLDVQATAFQWQVWQALQAIPYGETRTYSELARQHFDNANAARAVARACATNPVSIVVPCHRVVREDGSLGGYRWGLERKRKLLQQEQG
jgi:AraC family transcriptional regulator of adaptative response/methylated-DNA-[protein]-cysteine methyltransferase